MDCLNDILIPVGIFAGLGLLFGLVLLIASRAFAIKQDERVSGVLACLPGANCGGCGYPGCAALAEAIVAGDASATACSVGGKECALAIGAIMGFEVGDAVRMRAQVMCSGTADLAQKKYAYAGVHDCIAAAQLGGGDKLCPNGCIGLGTCVSRCPFSAISLVSGVAVVDSRKCVGCGICVSACPKHLIALIPFDSRHWVGCRSMDKGALVRRYCDAGCIGCGLCAKVCEAGAIHVEHFVAKIDYAKCTGCGKCAQACPRGIIRSAPMPHKDTATAK